MSLFFDLTLLMSFVAKKSRLRDVHERHAFERIVQQSIITRSILTLNGMQSVFALDQMSFTCQYRRSSFGKPLKNPLSTLIFVLTIDVQNSDIVAMILYKI